MNTDKTTMTASARPENVTQFGVGEMLIMRSPHTNQDIDVEFRGGDDTCCVIPPWRGQMMCNRSWLRRPTTY